MVILRNLAFYLVFYIGSAVMVIAALAARAAAPAHFPAQVRNWSRLHTWCVEKLLGIHIIETGKRPDTLAFYAIKHEAFFEAIAVPHLFEMPVVIAKQELFEIPGWGRAARDYGAIAVARGEGAKALRNMLRQAKPLARGTRPVILFPEGTRVPHGARPPLKSGFFALYKTLALPVVPVAVNSGPLYQRRWKKSGTLRIHFGEAIAPGLSREEIEQRVHHGINVLNTA